MLCDQASASEFRRRSTAWTRVDQVDHASELNLFTWNDNIQSFGSLRGRPSVLKRALIHIVGYKESSPVPARILPVANQAPHKTEGLPRRLVIWQLKSEASREQWRQLSTPFPRHIVRQFQSLYTPSPPGLIATPYSASVSVPLYAITARSITNQLASSGVGIGFTFLPHVIIPDK
jgi:hypothetical protein